jgi:hypothetical protein
MSLSALELLLLCAIWRMRTHQSTEGKDGRDNGAQGNCSALGTNTALPFDACFVFTKAAIISERDLNSLLEHVAPMSASLQTRGWLYSQHSLFLFRRMDTQTDVQTDVQKVQKRKVGPQTALAPHKSRCVVHPISSPDP